MRKKALSLFLALCMVISLIPTTFAAIGTVYEYKFNPQAKKGSTSEHLVKDCIGTDTNDDVVWVGAGEGDNTEITNGAFKTYMHKWNSNDAFGDICTNTTSESKWLALKIKINEAGVYSTSLVRGLTASGGKGGYGHIYLFPGDIEEKDIPASLTEANKIGTKIPYISEENSDIKTQSINLSDVTVKEDEVGTHILVFYAAEKGAGGSCQMYPNTLTLTKTGEVSAEPEDNLADEFVQEEDKEDITNPYVPSTAIGVMKDGTKINADPVGGNAYTLTAPDTNSIGKKFLYWALGLTGNKRIVSFESKLENYVPAEEGRNYLIAVYEGDIADTTNEYYNLNGQLIAKQDEEPAYPSIPGLGTATGWELCGGNIYVAKYADLERDKVTVIAVNCNVNGNEKAEVAYGGSVTCTATGTDTFKCWKKNGVIVSVDETYTFNAWEDCTVTAEYGEVSYTGSHMNILIDSFTVDTGVTGVMAEFIGFDDEDVVEKGIKFTDSENNEIKIPMTTTANQLAVIADAGKYEGYAILRSDNAYQMITDGLYEHK